MKPNMKKILSLMTIATYLLIVGCDENKPQDNTVVAEPPVQQSTAAPVEAPAVVKAKPAFAVFSATSGNIHVILKPQSAPADMVYQNICPAGSQPFGLSDINFGAKLYCNDATSRSIKVMDLVSNTELFTWSWPADIQGTLTWSIGRWQAGKAVGLSAYDSAKGVFHIFDAGDKSFVFTQTFEYGGVDASTLPLIGDWDGNGLDSTGVYRVASRQVYLRNSLDAGSADSSFGFGDDGIQSDALATTVNMEKSTVIALYSSSAALVSFRAGENSPAPFLFGSPLEQKFAIPVR